MRCKLIDDGAEEVWRNLVTVEFSRKMDCFSVGLRRSNERRGVGSWGVIEKMEDESRRVKGGASWG